MTVPESCVEFSGDTAFVYVMKKSAPQQFEKKQVKVGLSDGIKIEILNGLKAKTKIRGAEIVDKKEDVKKDSKK